MRVLAVLGLVACGSTPASATLGNQQPPAPPKGWADDIGVEIKVTAVRPELDLSAQLPDLSEDLRWPLTMNSHPTLEPQYEIAVALAVPGVGWMDL